MSNMFNTTGQYGFDKLIQRYYTFIYVCFNNEEFYAEVSCKDIDVLTDKLEAPAIEFLTYKEMQLIDKPYNKELFDNIIYCAAQDFFETKVEKDYAV